MNVTEFATKTGVSPYAIRYYTRIGLLTPARQSDNRYRRFTNSDVDRLSFIHKAQELGFTLMEIRNARIENAWWRTQATDDGLSLGGQRSTLADAD